MNNDVTWVLQGPRLTEKAAQLGSDHNVYTFNVHVDANKIQIKQAIKDVYNVSPIKVNIINNKPERVRNRKGKGMKSGFKKAMIFLKKGDTIAFV